MSNKDQDVMPWLWHRSLSLVPHLAPGKAGSAADPTVSKLSASLRSFGINNLPSLTRNLPSFSTIYHRILALDQQHVRKYVFSTGSM